jgi:hypothetical protein
MKKIVLLSLMTLSGGLLGIPIIPQQANRASHQNQDRTGRGPRSPQRPVVQTPGPRITQDAGRQLNNMFQRALTEATNERPLTLQPTAQPLATTTSVRQAHPRNLNLNTQRRVNDDDTPGAPRARDEDETNS